MNEDRERKKLKKKVLDRWENEGGRLDEVNPKEPPPEFPGGADCNERSKIDEEVDN
jgi:hypothetical protein